MTKILNLSKIICLVINYGDKKQRIPKELFFERIIKKPVVGEGDCSVSIYRKHIETCKELNLLEENDDNYLLTTDGMKYYETISLENNQKSIDTKTPATKELIINKIIVNSTSLKKQMNDVEINIEMQDGNAYFVIPESEINKIRKRYLILLKDIGLLTNEEGRKQVSEKIIKNFVKRKTKGISEDELYKILKRQQEVGLEAEKESILYEKTRLNNIGVDPFVVDKIKRVSKDKTNAGYDIASFNGEKHSIVFDRFIEVKATTGNYPMFYWSENEIEKSKQLGERYFIYLWVNFGKPEQKLLTPIQNPYEKIWKNELVNKHGITTWRVIWNE
ncbi:MAG: DUF3883 domain-containing protein [Candidatus Nitrosopelagicus sp.]|jgi:hypothetical protein|nr:DUF3883 domain-containing protein [Candidatus Nitrosopelagicus sp.]